METLRSSYGRYRTVTAEKSKGATYTPRILADFVARQIIQIIRNISVDRPIRVLDPAIGDGELVVCLLNQLASISRMDIEICGFETDPDAINIAKTRIKQQFPESIENVQSKDFMEFILDKFVNSGTDSLFKSITPDTYDLIIANPPYVRTQIMGASQAQYLSKLFDLSGRVDLYYAFILGIAKILDPNGIAGIIVSNRFMTTKSGAPIRQALLEHFNVRHIWDLGDTKLFGAAVLPAVLLVEGKKRHKPKFPSLTSIYETTELAKQSAIDPIDALTGDGLIQVGDGRRFHVQHGRLHTDNTPDGVWRIATGAADAWLSTVKTHTWGIFRDIGKIRVGVKTCADKIFIRSDWQDMPEVERPELLKPITTHHVARRFKSLTLERPRQILYPHEVMGGRRQAVSLSGYPRSEAYLERHRLSLEGRRYVREAGRWWYEIWVPQDPIAWSQVKLVFRDIAKEPSFWIDKDGTIVNGDCYWVIPQNPANVDLLWLAVAVGNSTFIEKFYDHRFHNKLYSGRRRFITQYVEEFPLPYPYTSLGRAMISSAKKVYDLIPSPKADQLQEELDFMVWEAFLGSEPC